MVNDADDQKDVLIVDDNDLTRSMIGALLDGEGFTVQMCSDGISALESAKARCFHAYIIDYHLPHIKGDVLASVLRKLHPAAIIIGCSIVAKERTFLSAGANCFILKEELASNLLPALARALPSN
jgi:CheY-like chemotaxis protein